MCEQTDRQTDRHTGTVIAILLTPVRGKVKYITEKGGVVVCALLKEAGLESAR